MIHEADNSEKEQDEKWSERSFRKRKVNKIEM